MPSTAALVEVLGLVLATPVPAPKECHSQADETGNHQAVVLALGAVAAIAAPSSTGVMNAYDSLALRRTDLTGAASACEAMAGFKAAYTR